MRPRRCHTWALTAALVASACGTVAPRPKTNFAASRVFASVESNAEKFVSIGHETEHPMTVVSDTTTPQGGPLSATRPRLLVFDGHLTGDEGNLAWRWKRRCQQLGAKGHRLESLTKLEPKAWVLWTTRRLDPDEYALHYSVVDAASGCQSLFTDKVVLALPDRAVTHGIRFGIVGADGKQVVVHDQPSFLHLRGHGGMVGLLTRFRRRELSWGNDGITPKDETISLVYPQTITAHWQNPRLAPVDVVAGNDSLGWAQTELVAGSDSSGLLSNALRPGHDAALTIMSEEPIHLVEIVHGCHPGDDHLRLARKKQPWAPGEGPAPELGISAVGRTLTTKAGFLRSLLLFVPPRQTIVLPIAAASVARCIRGLRAYGYRQEKPRSVPDAS